MPPESAISGVTVSRMPGRTISLPCERYMLGSTIALNVPAHMPSSAQAATR